ncbi:hypothetical protein RRSWK_03449 [Rhodopirellula sp. SWK7]|nr:hypothetical protein RRSWK_03449 [Rhodopirellula sp. SWK7]
MARESDRSVFSYLPGTALRLDAKPSRAAEAAKILGTIQHHV